MNILYAPPYDISNGWEGAIGNYLYNKRKDLPSHELGVSSYGTCERIAQEQGINTLLAKPDATLNTTGVIGYFLEPDEKRVLVLFSSIKLGMQALLEMLDGYGEGLLLADLTYKICKEKTPMLVYSVVDIQQHGHVVAFGPSSHEDKAARPLTRMIVLCVDNRG